MNDNILLPRDISFHEWACKFIANFPDKNIPYPNYINWRTWGQMLMGIEGFYNVPTPHVHMFPEEEDWRTWAYLVLQVLDKNA